VVFWDNLLRYPKFFISSLIGLILIIISPIIGITKDIKNINFIFALIFLVLSLIIWILLQMLNLTEAF
jgi:hypothetical protein